MSGLGDPNSPPTCPCPHYFSKYQSNFRLHLYFTAGLLSDSQNPFCPTMEGRAGILLPREALGQRVIRWGVHK